MHDSQVTDSGVDNLCALTGLKSLYDDGHLGIVQGVGYPNPNRSHFRATDIWESAQPDADPRRALYARLVLDHRLSANDPLAPDTGDWEREAAEIIFSDLNVSLLQIVALLDG